MTSTPNTFVDTVKTTERNANTQNDITFPDVYELIGVNISSDAVYVNKGLVGDNGLNDSSHSTPSEHESSMSQPPLKQNEENDFDDIEDSESPGCLVQLIVRCQSAVHSFCRRHGHGIRVAFLVLLVVAYFAYFSYALYYHFGDEGSIRLLWITCLVVACMAVKLVLVCCRSRGETLFSKWSMGSSLQGRRKLINWVVLASLYVVIVVVVVVDLTTISKNAYNIVSLSGIITYILLMFVFSTNPAKVNWTPVLWGICLQFLLGLIILRWSAGYIAFQWLGERVVEFLGYSDAGAIFVFGETYMDHFFAFKVLPVVIFFSSVVSVLFYLGVMRFVISKIAWIMQITMETTAAESLSMAGNIFLGQTEAPLLIRPFLKDMTRSELHAVLTGGFATIAGSVMAAYVLFGVPANHLLSASVMSAPAALACAKLMYPETKKSKTTATDIKNVESGTEVNIVDAAASGASNAISLAANIAANLIAFIALLQFINSTLTWFGQRVGVEKLTFQMICSYVLWPFSFVMGVHSSDCRKVAQLIGTKTILNEFVAYADLSVIIDNRNRLDAHVANNGSWSWDGDDVIMTSPGANPTVLVNGVMTERSILIATYALCGFSNLSSIGIQIGGLGALAPSRRSDLASVAVRAMIAGNIACFMTACIAGLFFQEA